MGFYGNITNINKTQFTFDKIYPNRVTMDKEANRDGIYVGRYVLVDYDKGSNYQEKYQRVYTNDEIHFYFTEDLTEESQARYLEDENRRDPVSHLYYISKNQIVYVIFQNKIKYYICDGEIQGTGLPDFIEITNNFEDKDIYLQNYFEDKNKYPDMGRGYDSTVWQKVYVDGKEKYAMIAELNSVVPTFDVTVDAPTINPIQPHFDIDSTDVYYKLHLQPSWGFRVAQKNEEFKSDEAVEEYESWDWDPVKKEKIPITHHSYPGAIYYNKKGFNAERHYIEPENEEKVNCIKITPTGQSGAEYNTHDNNNYIQKKVANDIQELSIQLPTIGDTISQIWDIVYGIDEGISEVIDETRENKYFPRNTNLDWNSTLGTRLIREKTDGSGFEYDTENLKTVAGCINSIHDLMGRIIANESENITVEEVESKLNTALSNYIYYGNYDKDNLNYKSYFIKEPYFEIVEDKDNELKPEKIDLKDFNANNYYYTHSDNYYLEKTGYHSGNVYYTLDVNPNKQELIQYLPNIYYYQDEYKNFILSTVLIPDESKDYYSANETINPLVIINYNKGQIFAPTSQDYFENTDIFAFSDNNTNSKDNKGWFYLDRIDNVRKPLKSALTQEQIAAGRGSEELQPLELLYSTGFRMEKGWDPIKQEIVQTYEFDKQGTNNVLYTEGNNLYFYTENTYYYLENVIDEQGNLVLDDKGNPKKNYKLLNSQDDILLDREYIAFGGTNDASKFTKIEKKFYKPKLYYYKEGSNYILAKEEIYYENKEYYIMNSEPDKVKDIFYEPNKYYYWNEYQQDYIIDKNKTITLFEDEEQTIPRIYYKEGQLHWYILEDEKGILPVGSRLNLNLIKDNKELPEGLKVGVREEHYKWTELTGFARTLNTVHGLILELNRLIKFDDVTTRDSSTVQGCINLINDIIAQFGKLTPGELVVVDSYGRMTSAKPNSVETAVEDRKLKYNYSTEVFEEIQNNNEINQGWIGFDITDKENLTIDIGFGHKYNGRIDENDDLINPETIQIDMNNQQGDTIGLISPIIDNTGHVVALNTEAIKLPNSYKSIVTGDTSAVAQNSKDSIIIETNKWLAAKAETDENGKSLITFTHEYPYEGWSFGIDNIDLNGSDGTLDCVTDVGFDDLGHVISKKYAKYTLPYGFKYVGAEQGAVNEAKSAQDRIEIIGDFMTDENNTNYSWIKTNTTLDKQGDKWVPQIKISHDDPTTMNSRSLENINLQFGDSFDIEDWIFDKKGHKANMSTHSITLPQGNLVEQVEGTTANELNAIANILFDPKTGTITLSRRDINDFKLKAIDENITQTLTGQIDFTESLGQALYKLQQQLNVLNGNSEIEGSIDNKVQVLKESVDNQVEDLKETMNEKIEIIEKEIESIFNNSDEDLNSLDEISGWIEEIAKQNFLNLNQADITLDSRCNVLDKEVKNLINIVTPYEEKIKYLDEKIKYLEDKIKALTNE